MNFEGMPPEIRQWIFSFLAPEERQFLKGVSKSWENDLCAFLPKDRFFNQDIQALRNVQILRKYKFNLLKNESTILLNVDSGSGKLLVIVCSKEKFVFIPIIENLDEQKKRKMLDAQTKQHIINGNLNPLLESGGFSYTIRLLFTPLKSSMSKPFTIIETPDKFTDLRIDTKWTDPIIFRMVDILNLMAKKAMTSEPILMDFNGRKRKLGLPEKSDWEANFNSMQFQYRFGKVVAVEEREERNEKRVRQDLKIL